MMDPALLPVPILLPSGELQVKGHTSSKCQRQHSNSASFAPQAHVFYAKKVRVYEPGTEPEAPAVTLETNTPSKLV